MDAPTVIGEKHEARVHFRNLRRSTSPVNLSATGS